MKNAHERLFEKTSYKIDEAELYKLSADMEKYWGDIERINKIEPDEEHFLWRTPRGGQIFLCLGRFCRL